MEMRTEIDPAGFVPGSDHDLLVELERRVRAGLIENRRPTPFELALGFQIGSLCVQGGVAFAEVAGVVSAAMTDLWAELVEEANERREAALPDTSWTEAWAAFDFLFRERFGEMTEDYGAAAEAGYEWVARAAAEGMVRLAGGAP